MGQNVFPALIKTKALENIMIDNYITNKFAFFILDGQGWYIFRDRWHIQIAELEIICFYCILQTMRYLNAMFQLNVCKAIRELECFLCWSRTLPFVVLYWKNKYRPFVT